LSRRRRSRGDPTLGYSARRAPVHTLARVRDSLLAKRIRASTRQPSPDTAAKAVAAAGPPPDEAAVLRLVRDAFPMWRDSAVLRSFDDSQFFIRPLTGGSSNTLWLCSLRDEAAEALEAAAQDGSGVEAATATAVVVRFYGCSLDVLIERSHEAEVADLLSQAGIGARIYWHFTQPAPGRIEQFIPGRTLRYDELAREEIARPIAQELARLHCTLLPPTTASASSSSNAFPVPVVFENLLKYFKVALTARAASPHAGVAPFDATSASAQNDLFSRDAQAALFASLGLPDVEGVLRSGEGGWDLARVDALDLSGDPAALPPFIRENRWFREVRWLHNLLANWNALDYTEDAMAEFAGTWGSRTPRSKAPAKTPRKGRDAARAQEKFLRESVAFSQPGLCHNDLNPGNILYSTGHVPHEDEHADSSSAVSASASASLAFAPGARSVEHFTLIDFEYAATNLPAFDLANHLCERSLDYSQPGWPFFRTHHARFFPSQEHMRDKVRFYCEAKAKRMSPPTPLYPHAQAHLYVSTLTSMMASHLLWALWAVIQSAGVAPSSADRPSWGPQLQSQAGEEGERKGDAASPSPSPERPYFAPPLAFLEYAETRLELYSALKALWLTANFSADSPFGPPPPWQAMDSPSDWKVWLEQLDELHDDMRKVTLVADRRQREALKRYQAACQQEGKEVPWRTE